MNEVLALVPLSLIGVWRWSMWIMRRIGGSFYRPLKPQWPAHIPLPTVSVVVPVYNEDIKVFKTALESWVANGVSEIVAVIDHTNIAHQILFERMSSAQKHTRFKLIVTRKPGKRPALADGCEVARGEIIALVDSDTIWSPDVAKHVMPYFLKPNMGGVSAQQRVYKPKTLAQVLFDMVLWTRYNEELPFLLGMGKVINTLSGRTAFYRREALLEREHQNLHHLTHEFFGKGRSVSGDDKRLTHLVMEQGWYTDFARNAIVYTPGMEDMRTFFKQRLRWTRNSWRADSRAFKRKWIFKHPALAIHNLDRFLQPFFMLLGPIVLIISIAQQLWLVVGVIIGWWFGSRLIKLSGYFIQSPSKIIFLPAYIIFSYVNTVLKIYALITIFEQGWITRWDASRMKRQKKFNLARGVVGTLAVIGLMVWFAHAFTLTVFRNAHDLRAGRVTNNPVTLAAVYQPVQPSPKKGGSQLGVDNLNEYAVQPGDSLSSISESTHTDLNLLIYRNGLNRKSVLHPGDIIYY